jgi:hypothetical protein
MFDFNSQNEEGPRKLILDPTDFSRMISKNDSPRMIFATFSAIC